ncbi:hypothetical protein AB0H12_36360 [Actinosynnema sp. NPDC023794]
MVGLFNIANTASGAVFVLYAVGPGSAMGLTGQVFGLLLVTPAAGSLLVAAAFAVAGGGIAVLNVVAVSLRQHVTPDRLLGRVNSAYRLVAWGTMPLGAAFGLRAVFVIMTAVSLVTLVGLSATTDRKIDAAPAV